MLPRSIHQVVSWFDGCWLGWMAGGVLRGNEIPRQLIQQCFSSIGQQRLRFLVMCAKTAPCEYTQESRGSRAQIAGSTRWCRKRRYQKKMETHLFRGRCWQCTGYEGVVGSSGWRERLRTFSIKPSRWFCCWFDTHTHERPMGWLYMFIEQLDADIYL